MTRPAHRAVATGASFAAAGVVLAVVALVGDRVVGGRDLLTAVVAVGVAGSFLVRPRHVVIAVAAVFIVCQDGEGLLGFTNVAYRALPTLGQLQLSPADLAVIGGAAIVTLRRGSVDRLPTVCLMFLAASSIAVVAGAYAGFTNGGTGVVPNAKIMLYVVAVPLLITFGIERRDLPRIPALLVAAGGFVGAVGVLNVVTGSGAKVAGVTLSYFDAGSNEVVLLGMLCATAMLVGGARRIGEIVAPGWLISTVLALCVASLYLSQRRSFWIAGVLGIVIVSVWALGPRRQTVALATAATVALLLVFVTQFAGTESLGLSQDSGSQFSQLHPERGDDYRNAERANVWDAIESHPVGGLGFGVEWTAVEPLPGTFPGGFQYTHVGVLWLWMKTGIFGPVSYVLAMIAALALARRNSSERGPPARRPLAVSCGVFVLLDVVLELTATFAPVDPRYTFALYAALGILMRLETEPGSDTVAGGPGATDDRG